MLAKQLLRAAQQLTEQIGTKLESDEQKLFDEIATIVHTALQDETAATAWHTVTLEQGIHGALNFRLAES